MSESALCKQRCSWVSFTVRLEPNRSKIEGKLKVLWEHMEILHMMFCFDREERCYRVVVHCKVTQRLSKWKKLMKEFQGANLTPLEGGKHKKPYMNVPNGEKYQAQFEANQFTLQENELKFSEQSVPKRQKSEKTEYADLSVDQLADFVLKTEGEGEWSRQLRSFPVLEAWRRAYFLEQLIERHGGLERINQEERSAALRHMGSAVVDDITLLVPLIAWRSTNPKQKIGLWTSFAARVITQDLVPIVRYGYSMTKLADSMLIQEQARPWAFKAGEQDFFPSMIKNHWARAEICVSPVRGLETLVRDAQHIPETVRERYAQVKRAAISVLSKLDMEHTITLAPTESMPDAVYDVRQFIAQVGPCEDVFTPSDSRQMPDSPRLSRESSLYLDESSNQSVASGVRRLVFMSPTGQSDASSTAAGNRFVDT